MISTFSVGESKDKESTMPSPLNHKGAPEPSNTHVVFLFNVVGCRMMPGTFVNEKYK